MVPSAEARIQRECPETKYNSMMGFSEDEVRKIIELGHSYLIELKYLEADAAENKRE